MLLPEERSVKGFRPGRCGLPPERRNEEEQILHMAEVDRLAARVVAGLPLFPEENTA